MTTQRIIVYIYYHIARENKLFYKYKTTMLFLYVGRLDKEKGITSLIFCIKKLISEKVDFHIHIYWKWEYTKEIEELSITYKENISYYWWKNKKDIITQRKKSDFFIMPSTFLETFWLTACESLLCGVPVIWQKKWWLIPFIHNDLNIIKSHWKNDWEKLYNIIQYIITKKINKKNYNIFISNIKKEYTKEKWIKQLKENLSKNIIMISDFINYNWWWIETHINDASIILQENNYKVSIYGHEAPTWKRLKIKKILIMIGSFFNIWDWIKIFFITKKKINNTIWRHSISRAIWRFPLFLSKNQNQIITYHELWLFHPFPSKTTEEIQIPKARSLKEFIEAWDTNNFLKKIAIAWKYFMIRCIHKQLQKKVQTHIVPSERMIKIVQERHPNKKIICIPHFVII